MAEELEEDVRVARRRADESICVVGVDGSLKLRWRGVEGSLRGVDGGSMRTTCGGMKFGTRSLISHICFGLKMGSPPDDAEIQQIFEDTTDDSDIEVIGAVKRKAVVLDDDRKDAKRNLVSSPIRLTSIRDLPPSENVDSISLKTLLYHSSLSHMVQYTTSEHFWSSKLTW